MKQAVTEGTEPERKRQPQRLFNAKEKSQAILSLWSGRRSAASLMKELSVPWQVLHGWEQRAMAGILTALDPNRQRAPSAASCLPVRVERLISRALLPPAEPTTEQPT